ncbi:phosphatase PAP2 family protein [Couchioplanes caeruleus]|uniref:Phosphatase n=2 Tax=Couchioplanes caeruleus TaxID=56438 RepID=A0A1K0FB19_9ACTN|nr:phosphatase PAP2 family protein [Couchioplanes caeruleus]OJF10041.1 phosphatase [Couchioplanes caeruleus subsp. caeruleus]ROP31628.1 PAP2 superfamily protein [Couchioplanes caeruleus]
MRVRAWWVDLVLLAAFALLTVALARGHLLALDVGVADWLAEHRPRPLYWTLRVLNYLGQGGQVLMPVAVVLALLAARRLRSVRPLLVFAGAFLLTYATIGPLKIWLDRAAPAFKGPNREILFNPDASGTSAMSYPSGHVANAVVWYFVIALLLGLLLSEPLPARARLALRVAPPTIVFITTTYLGFHWITDSVAGLLLGLVLARVLARVPWGLEARSTPRPASPA